MLWGIMMTIDVGVRWMCTIATKKNSIIIMGNYYPLATNKIKYMILQLPCQQLHPGHAMPMIEHVKVKVAILMVAAADIIIQTCRRMAELVLSR